MAPLFMIVFFSYNNLIAGHRDDNNRSVFFKIFSTGDHIDSFAVDNRLSRRTKVRDGSPLHINIAVQLEGWEETLLPGTVFYEA